MSLKKLAAKASEYLTKLPVEKTVDFAAMMDDTGRLDPKNVKKLETQEGLKIAFDQVKEAGGLLFMGGIASTVVAESLMAGQVQVGMPTLIATSAFCAYMGIIEMNGISVLKQRAREARVDLDREQRGATRITVPSRESISFDSEALISKDEAAAMMKEVKAIARERKGVTKDFAVKKRQQPSQESGMELS